ncbi:MAG: bifunctional [glutamine synthetase] adenylyltransferase/[glutamine synthetase]-adenylyl-L-tyrosine phosphorylase [Caulobacterales bacterium]
MSNKLAPAGAPPDAPIDQRWAAAMQVAAAHAPYLAGLMARFPAIAADGPSQARAAIDAAVAACAHIAHAPIPFETAMATLRQAKARMHLATALLDLSGSANLDETTGSLTRFADAAVRAALSMAAHTLAERADLRPTDAADPRGPIPGFVILAMGKGGAFELNYSSDVDLSIFFDPVEVPVGQGREARVIAQRITQLIVRALDAVTADGYVMRTDLRLRPDPNSTSPAVSIPSAQNYYQSVGQNWERAAFIKARACAGDPFAGKAFLQSLEPFIWRRHLDFATIEDINAIKRRIRLTHGTAERTDPAVNVKLAQGGIRDIELFAQTQLLIRGGRMPALQRARTQDALRALANADALNPAYAQDLCEAYEILRHIEHRIQMRNDAQTHTLPADHQQRTSVALLSGLGGSAALDALVRQTRETVARIDAALFAAPAKPADPLSEIRFTGPEDDPAALQQLAQLGFVAPTQVSLTVRRWLSGGPKALRTERARRLLQSLLPQILEACAANDEPDMAFARFTDLLEGLSAGVPLLSLFEARPEFIAETITALAISPRLAAILARRPSLLDGLSETSFHRPITQDPPDYFQTKLKQVPGEAQAGLEAAMNAVRRTQREEVFRICLQALKGQADCRAVGHAFSDLAEASLVAMANAALADTIAARGPEPGAFAVLALGKLGGRELTVTSDLDIMVVYDAPAAALDSGEAQAFYSRLTQRLIAALSAPTEEGVLYPVDMQLRPSGSKGPVAVRLSSFSRYYRQEAWTWELLALSRARPGAGAPALCAHLHAEMTAILATPREFAAVKRDTADMRALMDRERPPRDGWDVKLRKGGLVDIEFIAQALQIAGPKRPLEAPLQSTAQALEALARAGALSSPHAAILQTAFHLCSAVQQAQRLCLDTSFSPETAGLGLKAFLAKAAGLPAFPRLEQALDDACGAARTVFLEVIGEGSDGIATNPR